MSSPQSADASEMSAKMAEADSTCLKLEENKRNEAGQNEISSKSLFEKMVTVVSLEWESHKNELVPCENATGHRRAQNNAVCHSQQGNWGAHMQHRQCSATSATIIMQTSAPKSKHAKLKQAIGKRHYL